MKNQKQTMISKKELKEILSMTWSMKRSTQELVNLQQHQTLLEDSEFLSKNSSIKSHQNTPIFINLQSQRKVSQIQKLLWSFSKCQKSWSRREKQSTFISSSLDLTKVIISWKLNFESQSIVSLLTNIENLSQKMDLIRSKKLISFQNWMLT